MKKSVFVFIILIILLLFITGCDNNENIINNDGNDETFDSSITIGFANDNVTISGSEEGNIIYKTGTVNPNSLILTVSGFDKTSWYVNTTQTPTSTESVITLNASDFTIGVHTVSFVGSRNGRIISDSIKFSVYP